MSPTLSPQQFVQRWRAADQKERSISQPHFIDLCRLIEHPTPVEADPKGSWFAFEMGANKSTGGDGFKEVSQFATTFETFPFPWPPGTEAVDDPRVQAIALAAQELNSKRENWLNPPGLNEAELKKRTLTNLYNARPTWLDLAHKKLDAAVAVAYGWPADLPDEEILAHLLALNLARAGQSPGKIPRETPAGW